MAEGDTKVRSCTEGLKDLLSEDGQCLGVAIACVTELKAQPTGVDPLSAPFQKILADIRAVPNSQKCLTQFWESSRVPYFLRLKARAKAKMQEGIDKTFADNLEKCTRVEDINITAHKATLQLTVAKIFELSLTDVEIKFGHLQQADAYVTLKFRESGLEMNVPLAPFAEMAKTATRL